MLQDASNGNIQNWPPCVERWQRRQLGLPIRDSDDEDMTHPTEVHQKTTDTLEEEQHWDFFPEDIVHKYRDRLQETDEMHEYRGEAGIWKLALQPLPPPGAKRVVRRVGWGAEKTQRLADSRTAIHDNQVDDACAF